jgi:hypothetical protein
MNTYVEHIYLHHSRFLAVPFCSVLFRDLNAAAVAFPEPYTHTFGQDQLKLITQHEALTEWYDYPECVHEYEVKPVIIWLRSIERFSCIGFVKYVGQKVHYKSR